MPFGFHLAMDTLPSAVPTSLCGQRVVTPAFGYGTPHLSTRGTSTLLNNALLSAHYRDSDFTVVERVTEIAKKRGVSNAQVALAWMLTKPEVSAPIVGASKMHHLDDALNALELHLDAEEIKALEEPYEPHPILGHN